MCSINPLKKRRMIMVALLGGRKTPEAGQLMDSGSRQFPQPLAGALWILECFSTRQIADGKLLPPLEQRPSVDQEQAEAWSARLIVDELRKPGLGQRELALGS
jgi:hypothetical protein